MKFGVGQAVRRKEDTRLVSGRGQYTDDLTFEGIAWASFVRSPHAHAIIRGVDASAAEGMPGVLGVITAKDVADTGYVPVRGVFKNRDGSLPHQSPKRLLPHDKARFAGEPIVMVVAETAAQAQDAAEAIIVDYEPIAAVVTAETAGDVPPVWDHAPGNLAFDWDDGDEAGCEAAFARAACKVKLHLVQNRVVPAPMEPRGAIGLFDPATGLH